VSVANFFSRHCVDMDSLCPGVATYIDQGTARFGIRSSVRRMPSFQHTFMIASSANLLKALSGGVFSGRQIAPPVHASSTRGGGALITGSTRGGGAWIAGSSRLLRDHISGTSKPRLRATSAKIHAESQNASSAESRKRTLREPHGEDRGEARVRPQLDRKDTDVEIELSNTAADFSIPTLLDTVKTPVIATMIEPGANSSKFKRTPFLPMASVDDFIIEPAERSPRANPQLKDMDRALTASKAALLQQEEWLKHWKHQRTKLACCARMITQLLVCIFFLLMMLPEDVADLSLKMFLPVAVGFLLMLELPTLVDFGPWVQVFIEVLIVMGFFCAMVTFVALVENSAYTVVKRVRECGVDVANAAAERGKNSQYSRARGAPEEKRDVAEKARGRLARR